MYVWPVIYSIDRLFSITNIEGIHAAKRKYAGNNMFLAIMGKSSLFQRKTSNMLHSRDIHVSEKIAAGLLTEILHTHSFSIVYNHNH